MYFLPKVLLTLTAGSVLAAAVPHELVKRADLRAFDVSRAQAPYRSDFWVCAHNAGYSKAIIRAYQQACGSVSYPSSSSFPHLQDQPGRPSRPQLRSGLQSRQSSWLRTRRWLHVPL